MKAAQPDVRKSSAVPEAREESVDKCRCAPESDSEEAAPRAQGLDVTKASAARPAPRATEIVPLCAGERQRGGCPEGVGRRVLKFEG